MVMFDGYIRTTSGVGLAVGRQPSKLIYTGSIPVPRSKPLQPTPHLNNHHRCRLYQGSLRPDRGRRSLTSIGTDSVNAKMHSVAGVAQLVEHLICNQRVGGSNPSASSNKIKYLA